jgi:hypothetical protein
MRTNVSVARDRTASPVGRLRTLTRLRVPALAAVIALALVGCAPNLPVARPDPVPAVPPPVLSVAQSTAVLGSIKTVLAAGDANLSDVALGTRLSGPALAIRSAEYKLDLGTGGVRVPTMLPMTAQALITPQTTTWPRSELVVTVQPDNLQSPRLLVLRQDSPRDQYKLWGWTRLLAGVKMPRTADPALGSPLLAPDASGFVSSPQDVVAHYVDVLSHGTASAYADEFEPDEYRTGLASSLALLQQGLSQVGTVADSYTVAPGELVSMATATGGALVVAGITTVTTATVTVAGASFTLGATEAALAGAGDVKQSEAITWSDMVAFYVPPSGSGQRVTVLAAEHQRVSVTAK